VCPHWPTLHKVSLSPGLSPAGPRCADGETEAWGGGAAGPRPHWKTPPPLEPPAVDPPELWFGGQCSVGSGRVDPVAILESLLQLLRAGALGAQPPVHPDCPPGAVPFRDLQCALYNGRPVLGTQEAYRWVPFYGAPNQCDLNCLAEGHAFYHTFGRVLDGTPCSPGTRGLCVAGRCLSAGCDGLLGSDAREDHCGRCGGANDSCLFVQRVFRDAGDRPPRPPLSPSASPLTSRGPGSQGPF
uniref:ADAMTS like 5 n=1 Tax=Equus asinus TaxID=9793 RepID=A0A9L0IDY5_EQUAS